MWLSFLLPLFLTWYNNQNNLCSCVFVQSNFTWVDHKSHWHGKRSQKIYLYIYLWYSSDVFKFNKNGLKQPFEDCRRMKDSFIKKRTNKRRWDRSALGTKRFSSVLHLRLRSFSFLLYTVFCLLFLKRDKQGKNWRISDISLLFSQIFLKHILRRNWSCTEKLCCISMMPN